jgi:hypothetical protein
VRDQHVLAPELAAVGRQSELALVEQAVAAGITVMAGLDLDDPRGLVARQLDLRDAAAQSPVLVDRGRVAVAEGQGRKSRGGSECSDQLRRKRPWSSTLAAAIDDNATRSVAHLEAEG